MIKKKYIIQNEIKYSMLFLENSNKKYYMLLSSENKEKRHEIKTKRLICYLVKLDKSKYKLFSEVFF